MKKTMLAKFLLIWIATTSAEREKWARENCEGLKIYTKSCVVEQIEYAPKFKQQSTK